MAETSFDQGISDVQQERRRWTHEQVNQVVVVGYWALMAALGGVHAFETWQRWRKSTGTRLR